MQLNLVHFLKDQFFSPVKQPGGPTQSEMITEMKEKNFLEYLVFHSPHLMKKYGGICRLSKKGYLISDPKAFKHILKDKSSNYSKKAMPYDRLKLLFGDGLIVSEGATWKEHRTVLHPVFNRERLERYSQIMIDKTIELLDQWQQHPPEALNINHEIAGLTLSIAFKSFGSYEATHKVIYTLMSSVERGSPVISFYLFLKSWIPTPTNLLFFSSLRKTNKILSQIFEARKGEPQEEQDAIDLLLNAKKTHGFTLTDSEMVDEFKTLLMTGYETTACALTWIFYLLAKHSEYREALETELESVLGDRLPNIDDCSKLPLTKAIILETLRLYPSIWVLPRFCIEKDELLGFPIPAKSLLMLNIYALHRNEQHWENPEVFSPERFMNESDSKNDPFSYLPFSIGPHSCIGSAFAMLECTLLLATIAQRFRIELIKNKDYKPEPYLSLRPPANLKMRPILR